MNSIYTWLIRPQSKRKLGDGLVCLIALGIIGFIDYFADYRVLFTSLYVLPIGYATLYVNRTFAIFLAIFSIILWRGGDLLGGAPSAGLTIGLWNDGITFSLYVIVIGLLDALRRTLAGLEAKVEERTQAVRREMEERQRLEREILDLSERERQSFGQELHDVVCQELAGTAMAGQMLIKKLQTKESDEAADAKEVLDMVYRCLSHARKMARGFFTTDFDAVGLSDALSEAVADAQERSGIHCEFIWQEDISISNKEMVMHLFRIAQEAIQNALKHAKASRIDVLLETRDKTVQLIVDDNGKGFSSPEDSTQGLGLRIMAYRAGLIGGKFRMEKSPSGGARIICAVPVEKILAKNGLAHQA